MTSNNRLLNYLKENPPQAKCVIVSDLEAAKVTLSYEGEVLCWSWKDGLICPGASSPLDIHVLAAEALVTEEIMLFLRMEGIKTEEVIQVNAVGEKLGAIRLNPPELGEITFDIAVKKEKVKELYERFSINDRLTEELIGEAIAFNVLSPFLSLVNL
jgi:hypothetical protein